MHKTRIIGDGCHCVSVAESAELTGAFEFVGVSDCSSPAGQRF